MKNRVRAFALHFFTSCVVAGMTAALVLGLWFPERYREIAGGTELFTLLVSVDVLLGPLLTFAVFDIRKRKKVLVADLVVIGALQLTALGYGLFTAAQARPVVLVFEIDRFKVVPANGVLLSELENAPVQFQTLSWTGPRILGTRNSRPQEQAEAIDLALAGFDRGERPSFWQPYELSKRDAISRARPVSDLLRQYANSASALTNRLQELRLGSSTALFLPLMAHSQGWVVLLRPDGEIAGFAPLDGFF